MDPIENNPESKYLFQLLMSLARQAVNRQPSYEKQIDWRPSHFYIDAINNHFEVMKFFVRFSYDTI